MRWWASAWWHYLKVFLKPRQIVFKALLTLHQMIRSGSTETLLEHLSQGDVLRLRNISSQSWEGMPLHMVRILPANGILGYSPPSNLGAYSNYLDARVKSFRELKHDMVRVQAESNRRSDGLGAGCRSRPTILLKKYHCMTKHLE